MSFYTSENIMSRFDVYEVVELHFFDSDAYDFIKQIDDDTFEIERIEKGEPLGSSIRMTRDEVIVGLEFVISNVEAVYVHEQLNHTDNCMQSGVKLTTRELMRLFNRLSIAGISVAVHVDMSHPWDRTVIAWSRNRHGTYRTLTVKK